MPVYEYRCSACNYQFELRQKFSEAPVELCPMCAGTVHKMVSASAFSLKGGGWYGDGYGEKAETAVKSESDSAAGTGTTADSAQADSETAKETATTSAQGQTESKSVTAENVAKPAAPDKPAVTEKTKAE